LGPLTFRCTCVVRRCASPVKGSHSPEPYGTPPSWTSTLTDFGYLIEWWSSCVVAIPMRRNNGSKGRLLLTKQLKRATRPTRQGTARPHRPSGAFVLAAVESGGFDNEIIRLHQPSSYRHVQQGGARFTARTLQAVSGAGSIVVVYLTSQSRARDGRSSQRKRTNSNSAKGNDFHRGNSGAASGKMRSARKRLASVKRRLNGSNSAACGQTRQRKSST
jgi:hypothetical protein